MMAPGPYAQPPRPPVPPPPPLLLPTGYASPVPTDTKATLSLVLGLLSMFCCTGVLTAVPAIVLGVMSRRDIARSGGTLGGEGLALGGIVTGALTTLGTVAYFVFLVAMAVAGSSGTTHTTAPPVPPYVTTVVPTPAYTAPLSFGSVHVVELTPGPTSLDAQLVAQARQATSAHETPVVYLYAKGATACDEFDVALRDHDLQDAFTKTRLIRVEASRFKSELATMGYDKPTYPWLLRIAPSYARGHVRVDDAISADEWDDNVASEIAPVVASFVRGTYTKREPPTALPPDAGLKSLGKPL